ncbi:MAG: hypothetical protein AAF582_09640 [Pseudomonadota bacterium]
MKTVISAPVVFLSAVALLMAPAASALSCAQEAANLQDRQSQLIDIANERQTLVDQVEAAGDVWEDVEIHRLMSASHAATADQAKAEYEALKADLMQQENALQAQAASLNDEVAVYTARCVDQK